MSIIIREALERDQDDLARLMEGERLRPFDRHWQNFIVADHCGQLVGAVQIRRYPDGVRELGSLVVAPAYRRRGLGSRLVRAALAKEPGRVFAISGRVHRLSYARWGFEPIARRQAPRSIRRYHLMGQVAGSIFALFQRRRPNRLAIYLHEAA